jgi:hypothetical protein
LPQRFNVSFYVVLTAKLAGAIHVYSKPLFRVGVRFLQNGVLVKSSLGRCYTL